VLRQRSYPYIKTACLPFTAQRLWRGNTWRTTSTLFTRLNVQFSRDALTQNTLAKPVTCMRFPLSIRPEAIRWFQGSLLRHRWNQ